MHRSGAVTDFARCARTWGRLAIEGELVSPSAYVGARLRFADGTESVVFRETARRGVATREPVVLVIQFRLVVLASRPLLHAAFRRECVLHTPLFAGFPGFRSKLWADDVRTGVYRGLYEWDGVASAEHYARRMVALLAPFSTPGTARHHVLAGVTRAAFLERPDVAVGEGSWWRPATPVTQTYDDGIHAQSS